MALDEVLSDGALDATEASALEIRTDVGLVRMTFVLVAAAGVTITSLAPSIVVGVHRLHKPLSFETWILSYPLTAVGLVGVILLWSSLSRRPIRSWPWAIWPLALLVLWSLLSVWWSVSPELTSSRALTAVGIAAFGVWFGYELRFDEQLLALALFSAAASLGSYVLIIWWPGHGRNVSGRSEWQGVFAGPNSLGPAAVIGIVAAIGIAVRYRRRVIVAMSSIAALANLVLLQKSASVTAVAALLVGAAAIVVVLLVRSIRARGVAGRVVGPTIALVGAAGSAVVATHVGSVASFFGQDPTLASRTLIWSDVRQFISDRPVKGYGYWAFWENLDYAGPTYERIGNGYGSAHNSFLEMGIGLGFVGVALFGLLVAAGVVAVSVRVWRFSDTASIWWAVVLAVVLTEHLMESFVLWHSYVWVLLIAAAFLPTTRRETSTRRDANG